MQAVNGFIPPSARHPVTPTTPEERGEVPIPLPVHCSHGGGSGGRQLYTKRTDHRFCCLPDRPPACPVFLRPLSYTDFPLIQERDVYGNPAALQYTKLIPSDRVRTWLKANQRILFFIVHSQATSLIVIYVSGNKVLAKTSGSKSGKCRCANKRGTQYRSHSSLLLGTKTETSRKMASRKTEKMVGERYHFCDDPILGFLWRFHTGFYQDIFSFPKYEPILTSET
jgi:hypothetical protein